MYKASDYICAGINLDADTLNQYNSSLSDNIYIAFIEKNNDTYNYFDAIYLNNNNINWHVPITNRYNRNNNTYFRIEIREPSYELIKDKIVLYKYNPLLYTLNQKFNNYAYIQDLKIVTTMHENQYGKEIHISGNIVIRGPRYEMLANDPPSYVYNSLISTNSIVDDPNVIEFIDNNLIIKCGSAIDELLLFYFPKDHSYEIRTVRVGTTYFVYEDPVRGYPLVLLRMNYATLEGLLASCVNESYNSKINYNADNFIDEYVNVNFIHGWVNSSNVSNPNDGRYRSESYISTDDVDAVYNTGGYKYYISYFYYNNQSDSYEFIKYVYMNSNTAIANEYIIDKELPYFLILVDSTSSSATSTFVVKKYNKTKHDQLVLQNRLNILLPDYWANYIKDKINIVKLRDLDILNQGDSFIFITDAHWDQNAHHSPALIKYIINNTSVSKVSYGGDILNSNLTKNAAICNIRAFLNNFTDIDFLPVYGNHDYNPYCGASDKTTGYLNENELYSIILKKFDKLTNMNGKRYYYRDNESTKFRYIYLDTCCENYNNLKIVNDTEQKTWLANTLTNTQSDYNIIIFCHKFFSIGNNGEGVTIDSSTGGVVQNIINTNYSNISATFVAVICGHSHRDYYTTDSTNGYPIICTSTDDWQRSEMYGGPVMTAGTTTEQCFDVVHIDTINRKLYFTRIGAGSDREFNY